MSRIDAWIQRHPLLWGELWAAGSLALLYVIEYERGAYLTNWLIEIPIFALGGLVFGYFVKGIVDRRDGGR